MPPQSSPQGPEENPADATQPSPLPQIRTFQGDVAEALHEHKESLFSLREKELARQTLVQAAAKAPEGAPPLVAPPVRPAPVTPEDPEEKRARWKGLAYALGTIIFLSLGGYAAYFAYTTYAVKTAVPVVATPANRFLPVTSTDTVDATSLTRDGLINLTAQARTKAPAAGSVAQLELQTGATSTSALLTSTELFLKLGARMPGNLVRAFDPLFMLGTLGGGEATSSTFLLIRLDSYENAFAGMLDWEPNMREDLLPIFQPQEIVDAVAPDAAWIDETLNNKDARALKAADGSTTLVYSFYNQNLLIITSNEATLRALVSKLDAEALKR